MLIKTVIKIDNEQVIVSQSIVPQIYFELASVFQKSDVQIFRGFTVHTFSRIYQCLAWDGGLVRGTVLCHYNFNEMLKPIVLYC